MNTTPAAIVTLTTATGYVFNTLVEAGALREWLRDAASVLGPGETLTYKAAE